MYVTGMPLIWGLEVINDAAVSFQGALHPVEFGHLTKKTCFLCVLTS